MAVRTFSLTNQSELVPGSNPNGFGQDVSITNTGAAAGYLDTEQQGTSSAGIPLSAGATMVWQKGRPLWVVAPNLGGAVRSAEVSSYSLERAEDPDLLTVGRNAAITVTLKVLART